MATTAKALVKSRVPTKAKVGIKTMGLAMSRVRGRVKLLVKGKHQIKTTAQIALKVMAQIKIKAKNLHQAKRVLRLKIKRLNQNLRRQVSTRKLP